MKSRKILASVLASAILLTGCGKPLEVGSQTYPTVGLFNQDQRSKNVCYEVSVGNVIWSIILIESVIFPVYFIGWSIQNPVRVKTSPTDDCTIDGV